VKEEHLTEAQREDKRKASHRGTGAQREENIREHFNNKDNNPCLSEIIIDVPETNQHEVRLYYKF
jgi:hypothetical protein